MKNKVEIVKLQIELTKGHVEAMRDFIASSLAHRDQTVEEFAEFLIRRCWQDRYA